MLPRAATEFYALQQRVNFATQVELRRLWQRMDADFDGSWRRIRPAVLAVLVESQRQVAGGARDYVPRVLAETGIPDDPMGELRPQAFVGMASDGRPLDTLADQAVVEAKTAVSGGATAPLALTQGGSWLNLMAALQVADVARQAVGVQVAAQRQVSNYVRVLNPPSCQRCAILAGRVYKWSTGFQRHPRCDCQMMPAANTEWAKAEGFVTSPREAFEKGYIKDLTKAQVKAIGDGADIGKVVNAYRGVSTTATRTRTIVKRAPRGEVLPGRDDLLAFIPQDVRFRSSRVAQSYPTPEGIYQQATSRDDAVALLKQYGYLD